MVVGVQRLWRGGGRESYSRGSISKAGQQSQGRCFAWHGWRGEKRTGSIGSVYLDMRGRGKGPLHGKHVEAMQRGAVVPGTTSDDTAGNGRTGRLSECKREGERGSSRQDEAYVHSYTIAGVVASEVMGVGELESWVVVRLRRRSMLS